MENIPISPCIKTVIDSCNFNDNTNAAHQMGYLSVLLETSRHHMISVQM